MQDNSSRQRMNTNVTMDEPKLARVKLSKLINKKQRKEMATWFKENLGRPNRNGGLWWTDEKDGFLLVWFRHDNAFVEFSLKYC